MRRKEDASRYLGAGDIGHLSGLPKQQNLGKRVKRLSARVEAGKAKYEGDEALAKIFVQALRAQAENDWATQHFHSYPARFAPEGAKIMLNALGGERFADPFCGGGTLVLEAQLRGMTSFGSDLSPIAILVSQTRTSLWTPSQLDDFLDLVDLVTQEAQGYVDKKQKLWIPAPILKIKPWYKSNMFNELLALYTASSAYHNEFSDLLRAVLSSIVVKYSLRASDTSNRVVYTPRKDGVALKAYADKAYELAERLHALAKLTPESTPAAEIALSDARTHKFEDIDTIATSPPYPGTYDYLPMQQLRLAWLGLEAQEQLEMGSRRIFRDQRGAYEKWKKDTNAWMLAAAKSMRSGGKMAVIVGEGISRGRTYKVAAPTKEAAARAKLEFIASGAVERRDPATQAKKIEYILAFRK
ncbi:MAG: hypothetical protein WC966_02075 [Bradymonadales bacterium]|jgi:hypothetical protein